MSQSGPIRSLYATFAALIVGAVLFFGGVASIAFKEVALGGVLMALGIATVALGYIPLVRFRRQARVATGDMQARLQAAQQAAMDARVRDQPGGERLP